MPYFPPPPAAAAVLQPYISGKWYAAVPLPVAAYSSGPNTTVTYFIPFYLRDAVTVAALGARTTTAGGNVRHAIYANNPATGRPTGALLAQTGDIAVGSTTNASGAITGGNVTLPPGLYWHAFQSDNSAYRGTAPIASGVWMSEIIGGASQDAIVSAAGGAALSLNVTGGTYGTFANMTAASFNEEAAYRSPMLQFQVA